MVALELAPDPLLGPVERRPMIGTVAGGDEDISAGDVEPDLDGLLQAFSVEGHAAVDRPAGVVREPVAYLLGPFPEGIGDLSGMGLDRGRHGPSERSAGSPGDN